MTTAGPSHGNALARPSSPLPSRRPDGTAVRASWGQQGLWFVDQLDIPPAAYAMSVVLELHGTLEPELLRRALSTVVSRHAALRTTLHRGADGTLYQRIGMRTDVPIDRVALAATDRWQEAVRRFLDEPFDLERDLMLRARLLAPGPGGSDVLVLCVHHVAADARSIAVVLREVSLIYRALQHGDDAPLAPPSAQYGDFAAWQHRRIEADELSAQLAYWRAQLAGHPAGLPLPTKGPRPAVPSLAGRTLRRTLPPALGAALSALCPVHRVSLFMVMLTAFKVLLYRYSGQGDVVVGTPAANRTSPEWRDVVGYFVNTLVLRTDLGDAPTLAEALRRVRATALAAYGNQELPFELLVRELQPARDPSRNPLFQIMFSYLEEDGSPLRLGDAEAVRRHDVDDRASPFDLTLLVRKSGETLELFTTYATDLYDEAFIDGFVSAYEVLLRSLPSSAEQTVSRLPILGETEYRTLVHEWNDTDAEPDADIDADVTLDALFDAQVERTPDAVALLHGDDLCTYRQLQARAEAIARHLGDIGVVAGDIVAISLERSIDLVAGVLGILACGATWLPLDPAYPEERRLYMLSDARAKALLTLSTQRDAVAAPACATVFVDRIGESGEVARERRARRGAAARAPAYLIYTSGSTGLPKGVFGTHAGTLNRFAWMWRTLPFVDGDTSCIKTASSFVDSVWEMLGPLLKGVPAVIVPQETLLDPRAFVSLLRTRRITSLVVVPSLLDLLVEELRTSGAELPMLRLCLSSGEALPAALAERFLETLPAARLLNLYGSSEVSADVTCHEPRRPCGTGIVPIGRPIANTRALVLDESGNPVPVGVPGELYIGGANVAAGYHERPELDASRFVESRHMPGRLFRTGDIVRWNTHGVLEFVGRRDNQFKIRGHRADTAEIEHAAETCPGVGQALAQVAGDGVDTEIRLFVVPADGSIVDRNALQRHLRRVLPRYLLPSALWILDALPLTPNGKTDRVALTALAETEDAEPARGEQQEASTPLEAELARIWADVLERPSIGVEENFFDIGGHSLLAVRLFGEIERSVKRRLPLTLIYELATIRDLARHLESDADAAPAGALMTLRSERRDDALFLVPPAGGTGMYYAKLADMLPREFDIYSFDSIDSPSFDSLESLAAHYIEEMYAVRRSGPWFLLGSCFGNHLAFEISRQLEERGAARIHLMLVDSSPPRSGPGWQTSVGPQRPDGLSRGAHYTRLLLSHYRAGTVHLLREAMLVRARWWFVARLRRYWKARRHQVSLIARYSASTGSASMRLYLSEEMSRRPQIVERWRALTNRDFGCDVLPIARHDDLARPDSRQWQMIAARIGHYLDGLREVRQDRPGG